MNKLIYFLFFFFLCIEGFSQSHTISGNIANAESKEPLINATVYEKIVKKGTYSNEYGFYSFTLPEGKVSMEFSYVGFKKENFSFMLDSDTTFNIELEPGGQINEVIITNEKSRQLVHSVQANMIQLQPEQVKEMPVLLGEPDLLKAIQFLPGVQSGNEGFSGMHVRGGSNDQNLILLDGVPVYNINHFFGLFSVFHPAAIKNVKLYKGGFPARYQGRVSSVLDIRMKEGNMKEYHGEGSIGLIASKIAFEGPIIKDTSSFIISARRTYLDLLVRPITSLSSSNNVVGYYFQDVNGKINYKFSDKSRLYLSGYIGKDDFYHRIEEEYSGNEENYGYKKKSSLEWGNQTGVLRWNYIFNPKLFSNVTCSYSNFQFLVSDDIQEQIGENTKKIDYEYQSGIRDLKASISLDFIPSPNHYIRFGTNVGYSVFNPGVVANAYSNFQDDAGQNNSFGSKELYAKKYAAYIEDEWEITKKLGTNIGVNYNGYIIGEKHYSHLEPRVSFRYLLKEYASIKASWGLMNQYLHLLTNSTIGLPTDLWFPSTEDIEPVHSSQYTLGFLANLSPSVDLTLEGFYKEMEGLTEYKEGASFFSQEEPMKNKIIQGKGKSYGGELFLKKTKGKTSGWISYTIAWANRTFEDLNFGEPYPFKYDRRHVLNLTLNHQFNKKVSINGNWIFRTGKAATFPTQYIMTDNPTNNSSYGAKYYPQKNNLRFPPYHRLDISLNLQKKKKWGGRIWRFGLYNAYSQVNPFYMSYDSDKESFIKVGIFPILPYISYNFKF